MGRIVKVQISGNERFIPDYRITFEFAMLPDTKRIVRVQGDERLHIEGEEPEQVRRAIKQAETMLMLDEAFPAGALNIGPRVAKVEREWESENGFAELICAQRVKPGMEIIVLGSGLSGPTRHRTTVDRWEAYGDGRARLWDTRGSVCGLYERDHIFQVAPSRD